MAILAGAGLRKGGDGTLTPACYSKIVPRKKKEKIRKKTILSTIIHDKVFKVSQNILMKFENVYLSNKFTQSLVLPRLFYIQLLREGCQKKPLNL